MVLNKLKLRGVQKLNEQEMKMFKGGEDLIEYCCGLWEMMLNNGDSWSINGSWEGFAYGMNLCKSLGMNWNDC